MPRVIGAVAVLLRSCTTWRVSALLTLLLVFATAAHADATARIVATDPAGDTITLRRGEPLYVRIEYATDRPISIWARPYFRGEPVSARSNASIPHDGRGDALGWFEFGTPGEVDEIRVLAGDGSPAGTKVVSTHRVRVVGTDEPSVPRVRAGWIDTLSQQEAAVRRADYEKRMSEPVTTGDRMFMSGFMLTMLALLVASLAWPAWAAWQWRGGWRFAAAVPLAVMAFIVLRIIVDVARDPTSHNLWPFEIVMWGGASLLFMLALRFARRFTRAS